MTYPFKDDVPSGVDPEEDSAFDLHIAEWGPAILGSDESQA